MGWRRNAMIVVAVGVCVAPMASAARTQPRPRGVSVSVLTAPGQTGAVQASLRARGIRVDRRAGRRLQVVVRRTAERRAIAALPGVATVALPPSAYGDVVISQGVARTGASALSDVAADGAGLRIAVLDLGFGSSLATLQATGELPPASRLVERSFDPAAGIHGTNAYGNLTDHGQLVAQTIYDYAPRATYLFVNYHTPDDFVAAVDWLATQHVDVLVHSNNFLDGPFDGTSAPARAVDRAAAAGILWFNSAGNYGEKHWGGAWVDNDGDHVLDWPGAQPWTIIHEANQALTFHLSWTNPVGAPKSDIDLFLEHRQPDGSWKAIASSTDKQLEGAPPSERINGLRPGFAGEFRLRAVLVSGPPPAGTLSLYSREDDILSWSGSSFGSIPTPADAAGSISIAAVDSRGNSLARYSSRGPTADGRLKPDLAAPTGTSLANAVGDPRDVGGTSIAAPNAAGAAAIALGAMRRSGLHPTVAEMRALLTRDALDLGDPGPDPLFGAGRIRVDLEPPELRTVIGLSRRPIRATQTLAVEATDAGQVLTWALIVDGIRRRGGHAGRELLDVRVGTRDLVDGPHVVALEIGDTVGNLSRRTWRVVTDNTLPELAVDAVDVLPAQTVRVAGRPEPRHPVRVTLSVGDGISRTVRVVISVTRLPSGKQSDRGVAVPVGVPRALGLGRFAPGTYRLRVTATDEAGNRRSLTHRIRVRP